MRGSLKLIRLFFTYFGRSQTQGCALEPFSFSTHRLHKDQMEMRAKRPEKTNCQSPPLVPSRCWSFDLTGEERPTTYNTNPLIITQPSRKRLVHPTRPNFSSGNVSVKHTCGTHRGRRHKLNVLKARAGFMVCYVQSIRGKNLTKLRKTFCVWCPVKRPLTCMNNNEVSLETSSRAVIIADIQMWNKKILKDGSF